MWKYYIIKIAHSSLPTTTITFITAQPNHRIIIPNMNVSVSQHVVTFPALKLTDWSQIVLISRNIALPMMTVLPIIIVLIMALSTAQRHLMVPWLYINTIYLAFQLPYNLVNYICSFFIPYFLMITRNKEWWEQYKYFAPFKCHSQPGTVSKVCDKFPSQSRHS